MRKDEAFIIGGGSSLKDFNFSKLKDKDTIAVNMAALDVPNPTYCITADSTIFRKVQEGYFKEVDTTWVLVTNPNHCSMKWQDGKFVSNHGFIYNLFCVNMIIRNADVEGIGFDFKDFKTGYNSGFSGFQLAVLLGYKKIYLLGFDLASGYQCHYHDRYKGRKIKTETFHKYHKNFIIALKRIKEETDIEVFSCSSISLLNKIIPYVSLNSITREGAL